MKNSDFYEIKARGIFTNDHLYLLNLKYIIALDETTNLEGEPVYYVQLITGSTYAITRDEYVGLKNRLLNEGGC